MVAQFQKSTLSFALRSWRLFFVSFAVQALNRKERQGFARPQRRSLGQHQSVPLPTRDLFNFKKQELAGSMSPDKLLIDADLWTTE